MELKRLTEFLAFWSKLSEGECSWKDDFFVSVEDDACQLKALNCK